MNEREIRSNNESVERNGCNKNQKPQNNIPRPFSEEFSYEFRNYLVLDFYQRIKHGEVPYYLQNFINDLKNQQTNLSGFIQVFNYHTQRLKKHIEEGGKGGKSEYYSNFSFFKEEYRKLYNKLINNLLKKYSIDKINELFGEETEQQTGEETKQTSSETEQQPSNETSKSIYDLKQSIIELLQVGEEDTRKSKQLEKLKNNGKIEPIPGTMGLIVLNITRGLGKLFENNKNPDNNEKNKTEGGNNTGEKESDTQE